jgi:hypothetical protein
VVVLDELDLGPLEDEVDLLDVPLFELDLGQRRGHLPEGQEAGFLAFGKEELDLIQFVKLSDSQVAVAPSCSAGSTASLYSESRDVRVFPIRRRITTPLSGITNIQRARREVSSAAFAIFLAA